MIEAMLGMSILGGLVTFILTEILIWDDSVRVGPFTSVKRKVVRVIFDGTDHTLYERPVNALDWVRRWTGLYKIDGLNWTVMERGLPIWECPKCLGFWLATFMSAWFFANTYQLTETIIYHLTITSINYILYMLCHR